MESYQVNLSLVWQGNYHWILQTCFCITKCQSVCSEKLTLWVKFNLMCPIIHCLL
jgi:hypothetical protein